MTRYIILLVAILAASSATAQHDLRAYIKDAETKEPLAGAFASLKDDPFGHTADHHGFIIIKNIPAGKQAISFSFTGYESRTDTFSFPLATTDTLEILLQRKEGEIEEVLIASTRSSRSIRNIPTRVEFIAGEELEEKANMKPGDIRMLLSESTGIQTQQTSATSANSSIRIQGLDGRYTQVLKDGFPLYSGAASGLGLLQTPPLDLKQAEIIKGSASTLYGGGAIAGLVNLISKTPGEKQQLRFIINATSASGLDISGFYAKHFSKTGVTLFVSHNSNGPYDPAGIDLTAIPKFERYTINPKLFLYLSDKTKLEVGINSTFEKRTGGDMHFIKGEGDNVHSYFEKNKTGRFSTQLTFEHLISDKARLIFRNSVSDFHRIISIPSYSFDGKQLSSFSEFIYSAKGKKADWVAGANLWTDKFTEQALTTFPLRNYNMVTAGLFIQNTVKANEWLSIESGLRADHTAGYGFALLPRVSALFKINSRLTSRVGGGLGYKGPSVFTEESERIQYRNVLPVSKAINKLERSYGVNIDLDYKGIIGKQVSFSYNQMFFYTRLNAPLVLTTLANGDLEFINSRGHIDTRGIEVNMKFGYGDMKLFLGYTLTDAVIHEAGRKQQNPLTARHRLNNVLMYEVEDKWKIGLEAYYFSKQWLNDGTNGRAYWTMGAMAERIFKHFSLYINFENLADTRQTRFGTIYSGTITDPVFKDIYAPLDGFVVNGGLKINL